MRTEILALSGLAALAACTPATSRLVLSECAIAGSEEKARCGALEVPENWSRPGGRTISLNVMVIPAVKKAAGATPLFDLAGGPGIAVTTSAGFYLTEGRTFRESRDVVLVDQRGTGKSSPLRCPELENVSPLQRMYPPEAVERCREALAPTHNLSQYTTPASARDIDAVRRALGAKQIDIASLSYGTKLAQAYMREFPTRVRAAVLIGAAPMDLKVPLHHARNAEDALRLIFADCAADAACNAAYPSLVDEWEAVLARFNAGPIPMVTAAGVLPVERGPFAEALRAKLTIESSQRNIPSIIHAAAQGDFAPYLEAVGPGGSSPFAEGQYLSIECSEGTARIAPAEVGPAVAGTFLGRYRVDEQIGACGLWPSSDIPEEYFKPVASAVPTLFFSGGRDHVTPPRYAEDIASRFSNSRIIFVEEMAHAPSDILHIECLDAMMVSFYASADPKAVDTACAAGMKAPPFVIHQ